MIDRFKSWAARAPRSVTLAAVFLLLLPVLAVWAVLTFAALGVERLMDWVEIWAVHGGDREAFERERDQ